MSRHKTSVMSLATPIVLLIAGPLSQLVGTNNWMVLSGALMLIVGALFVKVCCDLYSQETFRLTVLHLWYGPP